MSPSEICAQWREELPLSESGYAEAVDTDWRDIGGSERRMLSQSRLAYTFTHAGLKGDGSCASAGSEAIARVLRLFWLPARKGWARAVSLSGEIVDDTIDCYDQAFGLLALAWHYRATGDDEARGIARLAAEGLDESRSKLGDGFPEQRPGPGQLPGPESGPGSGRPAGAAHRRQNPHMHLLEAFLAWQAAEPSGPWLARAKEMVELFRNRFLDPADGTLVEYFEDDWRPALGESGALREPGHHFEWVWLLRRFFEASGDPAAFEDARRLYSFACSSGRDGDGLAFDGIDAGGRVLAGTKLLWPQTEMLKAHLAWYEWTAEPAARDAAQRALGDIRKWYMIPGTAIWHNQLGRDRKPIPTPTLSRLLYHLFLALAEAERVLG